MTESPESPDWDFSVTTITAVREYFGPYDVCDSTRPLIGNRMSDMDASYYVVGVKLKRLRGNKGMLVVTVESAGPTVGEVPPANEQIEIDWQRADQAIENHIHFNDEGICDKKLIRQYFDNASEEERSRIYASFDPPRNGGGEAQGTGQDLINAKLKGIEQYIDFFPVLKRTTDLMKPATEKSCGQLSLASTLVALFRVPVPMNNGMGENYLYMKTSDRCVRAAKNKRWERTEEYTGFVKPYDHLYKIGAGWYSN